VDDIVEPVDRIVYVGHATVLIELDGVRLLTDPALGAWVGPLRRQAPPPPSAVADGIDAVLISHLHRDHADLPSLRRLAAAVPLIVPAGTGSFFARHGFGEVVELAPGETHRLGPVAVTATAAHHELGRGLAADPVGFLVAGSRRLYFAGDTDLFGGMAELGEGLDLALLPVWGWGPSLGPGHLNPERAARAAALLSPRLAVPIHWGTLYPPGLARLRPRPLREPPREFAVRMGSLAPAVEARVLPPGSALPLPRVRPSN
jgi:L-ascorbate metabolism protein UlaG (beta-lactamase superfamily)